jgi:hypothetical protein
VNGKAKKDLEKANNIGLMVQSTRVTGETTLLMEKVD